MAKSGKTATPSGKTGQTGPKRPLWQKPPEPKPVVKPSKPGGRPPGRVIKVPVAYEYHPRHDEKHFTKKLQFFKTNLATVFQAVTGLQSGLLHQSVRDELAAGIAADYPRLRKSSLRLFMEGRLTKGKTPVTGIPTGSARHLENVLAFLDVIETLVYVDGLKRQEEFALLQVPLNSYKYRPAAGRRKMPGAPLPEDEAKAQAPAGAKGSERTETVLVDDPDEEVESMTDEQVAELEALMQSDEPIGRPEDANTDEGLEALLAQAGGDTGTDTDGDTDGDTGMADEREHEN